MATNQSMAKVSSRSKTKNVLGVVFFKKGETVVTLRRHLVGRRKRGWWWGFRDFSKHSWRDGEAVKWTFHVRSQTWFIWCWGSNRGLFVCWVSILPAEYTAALFSVTISWSRASGSQDWLGTHSVAKDLECILILPAPKCWDCRPVLPPRPFVTSSGIPSCNLTLRKFSYSSENLHLGLTVTGWWWMIQNTGLKSGC